MSTPPIVEIIPNLQNERDLPPPAKPDKKRRALLFAALFALSLASSLAYVWLRAPLYESSASLLTVAPEEAGQTQNVGLFRAGTPGQGLPPSVNLEGKGGGTEHVVTQRQILLGMPVFEETLRRLYGGDEKAGGLRLAPVDLRKLLSVEMVKDTNLVELRAQGPNPGVLAPLVNAWIDAYQALREQTVQAAVITGHSVLEEQARQLERKVQAKREALERFRSTHGILAKNDVDNSPMVRLKGLNDALTKAMDEQAKTKGKLEAIRAAIASGKPVMPPSEAPGLENLEKRAQELREQEKDLQRRYTPAYLAMHPQLKQIPDQLAQVEQAIREKAESGSRAMLGQTEQDYASAQRAVTELREKIADMKRESTEFSNRFTEQEAMRADLERLEAMHRETQAKLAQVESSPGEVYPPLQVVERAYPPSGPSWPDYWRDSGIALGASLLFALAFIWLYDYLTRIEEASTPAAAMPNFQFYTVQGGLPAPRPSGEEPALLAQQAAAPMALESPFPRELTAHEILVLLDAAEPATRRWIGLLLSGLSALEAAAFRLENLDLDQGRLRLADRTLPLPPRLQAGLAEAPPPLAADTEEVEARISCAAYDCGLPEPGSIDANALRHTYIAFLVRQGIRLSDLERVVGRLPARQLASYGRLSPPGPGLAVERVALTHPVMLDSGGLV